MNFIIRFLNSDSIKVLGCIFFIVVLFKLWNVDPITPIIENETQKVKNVSDKFLYKVDLVTDSEQINLITYSVLDNAIMELDLILPIIDKITVDLVTSALQRGVRVRIITKKVFKHVLYDLKQNGAIIIYLDELNSGFLLADNRIGVILTPILNNQFIATIYMNKDFIAKYKQFIDHQFIRSI